MVTHQAHNLRTAVRVGPPQQNRKTPNLGVFLFCEEENKNCFLFVPTRKPEPCRKATSEAGSRKFSARKLFVTERPPATIRLSQILETRFRIVRWPF